MKQQLGKYRIESELGKGAMGSVFKAWHPGFGEYVAIKTIQDTRLGGGELLDRFKVEGQNLAKLNHQNIVRIFDADEADGEHFIVMEYMNGGSLDRIIAGRESVPLAKRVGYLVPVCHALEYAHKRGLFHRDIKPANIMLGIDGKDEIVKVVDFGIARLVDSSQTQTNFLIGAPAYMAPELITASAKANAKTDIWALGVTLYELISYQRPFEGKDLEELKHNIVRGIHKPLTQIVPDCPKDLSLVVEKALQKDPGARYQTVEDLLLEFEPIAKRLRTDVAGSLVRRARDLVEIGEYGAAKSALHEAIGYDATNLQARSLLQNVDEELRRKDLLPRLQEDLTRARSLLADGRYREAREAAQHAIGLDSRFEPAQKLLGEIQEAEALAEEIQKKLDYARRCVEDGELTQASRTVEQVLSIDPENHEAFSLNAKIRGRREELERRKKVNQLLRSADDLLIVGKYDECLLLVDEALREFPENLELQNRKKSALAEKSEQLRQSLLTKAKKLRTSQQFDQALEILDELLAKFPGDSAGVLLRPSVQKDRDQEQLNKQLGVAWEELQSLKHQGKFSQAIDLAKDLVVKFPSEERIKEFIRELEAEIRLDQIHTELDATVKKIQEFMRDGEFSQAVHESDRALKIFPNNPLLVSLRKEAKAQQDRKDILEKQNGCLYEVRRLIPAGQFKAAEELARKGLTEFGEHAGLREALRDAERNYSLQTEKIRQQDLTKTKIKESCEKSNPGGATLILQNAERDGVIEKDTPLHATLVQYIERAKDQEGKERQAQIESRQGRVRQAVDRKDFAAAIRLADEFEREFGFDRKVSALRGIAESGLEADRIARQERDDVLQRASSYLDSGNVAAADQIIRNSLEAGILKESDPQVLALLQKTKEILDRDKERKRRVQAIAQSLRGLLRKGDFAEATEAGQRALEAEGHNEEIAELTKQAKVALVKEESLQKKRVAELRSIRGLLAEEDPHQAKRVLEDGLLQGVLNRKDPEVVELQRQVAEAIRSKAEQANAVEATREESGAPPVIPGKEGRNKWVLGGIAAGVLATVVGGSIYFSHHHGPPPSPPPSATKDNDAVLWNNAEDAMSQSPKDLKTALDDYEKVAKLHGEHQTLAQSKIDGIKSLQNEEAKLFQQAEEALKKSDYQKSIDLFTQLVKIDGDYRAEAEAGIKRATDLSRGKDPRAIADEDFKKALDAFKRRDYVSAQKELQALGSAPSDWGHRKEVEGYLARCSERIQQHESLVKAESDFQSKNYEAAQDEATRAAHSGDRDEDDANRAQELLKNIRGRQEQKKVFEQAEAMKGKDPQQARIQFQQVVSFPSGDPDLVANAKDEIARISPLKPYAPLVSQIDGLIGQRQFDAASDVLKQLPPDQADYGRLRSAIESGREDVAFEAKKDELAKAEQGKSEPKLRNLRDFFAVQQGRHHDEAVKLVSQIDADLKSLQPIKEIPIPDESVQIKKLLDLYVQAFRDKDGEELRSIWPAMNDKQFKGYFNGAESIQIELTDCDIKADAGDVSCSQRAQFKAKGQQMQPPLMNVVNFHMKKHPNGEWFIEQLSYLKAAR
jgi:serine/threonine protein kinase